MVKRITGELPRRRRMPHMLRVAASEVLYRRLERYGWLHDIGLSAVVRVLLTEGLDRAHIPVEEVAGSEWG